MLVQFCENYVNIFARFLRQSLINQTDSVIGLHLIATVEHDILLLNTFVMD